MIRVYYVKLTLFSLLLKINPGQLDVIFRDDWKIISVSSNEIRLTDDNSSCICLNDYFPATLRLTRLKRGYD
jgi:hypothetical protein